VTRAEAVRAGWLAEVGIENRAFRGIAPGARARPGIAQACANLFAARVARANLIRLRQAVRVRFTTETEFALTTDAPLDTVVGAVKRLVVADLLERYAAGRRGLSFHVARALARRPDDAAAVVARRAVVVALAINRAIRVQVARARAEAQARVRAFGAVRAAGVQLAGWGRRWIVNAEVSALTFDVSRRAMPYFDAVGMRLTLVVAFTVDAAEAVRLVAVATELAGIEAAVAGGAASTGTARVARGAADLRRGRRQRRPQKSRAVASYR